MKKSLCFVLLLVIFIGMALPVKVYAAEDNLVELLEYSTVNNSGTNMFQFTDTITVEIDVPMYTNLRYIDVIFLAHDSMPPTSVYVTYNGGKQHLIIQKISSDLYRAYGYIGGYFDSIFIAFNASGTQYYTIQSCKVSSLKTTFYNCTTNFKVQISGTYYTGKVGTLFESPVFDNGTGVHSVMPYQAEIEVTDAVKYDSVNLQFAVTDLSINSIRCTYGNITVPFTVNFIDCNSNETFTYYFNNVGEEFSLHSYGKYIGSIEVDLSGIDRASKSNLLVFFNGDGMTYGFRVNVSSVMGTVYFADTSEASWWTWGKGIMYNLEQLPKKIAEEFSKLYTPDQGKIESVKEQSADLAEDRLGAVAQAGTVIDSVVGSFTTQSALDTLTVPVLTVPLGEVDWTIGGWEVQVVPDAFKPIVEILKTVIDIVATLAFVTSMRTRFEKLLSGGNA